MSIISSVRRASNQDVGAIADVISAGFMDDDVFGRYMHPHRLEFPKDWNMCWQREMRESLTDKTHRIFVSTDDKSGQVVAVADWERMGEGAKELSGSMTMRARHLYMSTLNHISKTVWPDKSADPEHVRTFYAYFPTVAHHWAGARAETWYLGCLCVHPDHQGKGHGKRLIERGLEMVMEDKICASVIASEAGDKFYEKLGWVEVGSAAIGPLSDVKGGSIKFWEKYLEGKNSGINSI